MPLLLQGKVRFPHDNQQTVWDHEQVMFLLVCLTVHTEELVEDEERLSHIVFCFRNVGSLKLNLLAAGCTHKSLMNFYYTS